MQTYSRQDLLNAYQSLGVERGDLVYVATNLLSLGFPPASTRDEVLRLHFDAIRDSIGDSGTIVVPTYSFSFCNTDKVFDVQTTPSEEGPLTEFIRQRPGAVRQFHPFSSKTAVGPLASDLCENCSRHANGAETPFPRMCNANCKIVTIGLPPEQACSVIHHVEMEMGVPYRYVKEFQQPVLRSGSVETEPFYLYVGYRECDLVNDGNQRILRRFKKTHPINQANVGAGRIYVFSMTDLVQFTRELMKQGIYCCLKTPPEHRPYRN